MVPSYSAVLQNLKDPFDLNSDLTWKSVRAEGASRSNALIGPEHIGKDLATAVDHRRLLIEIFRAANEGQ